MGYQQGDFVVASGQGAESITLSSGSNWTPTALRPNATAGNKSPYNCTVGLWVGGAGDLYVDLVDGSTNVSFLGVPAGTWMPLAVTKIYGATSTVSKVTAVY
jgi:hypothetical protein